MSGVVGSLCSETGVVPRSACPPTPQHARRDRPRRHKGVDVSHPRCIMVSSRKHHRSVCRYRPDRGQGSCCRSRPLPGDGGTRSGTEEVVAGGGPVGGVRSGVFRVLGSPQGLPGGMAGTSRVSITNPGIRTPGWVPKNPSPARQSMTKRHVSGRRANHLPVLEHSPCRGIRPEGTRPDRRETGSPCAVSTRGQPAGDRRYGGDGR